MKEKLAYSIEDAADALSIGRTKLYELISAGKLSTIKVGRRTVIRRTELEGLLDKLASETNQ